MELNIRPLDMGYFGESHGHYGIVLHIDPVHQTLTVLDTTVSPRHEIVNIPADTFVVARNLQDMCVDASNSVREIKEHAKQNQRCFETSTGAQIVVNRNKSQVQRDPVAHHLFRANQTYSSAARNNPNYASVRESILMQLMDIEVRHPECFDEIARILDSTYDSHNRIVTLTAPGFNQTFHLCISVIGKQVIVHDAGIRYDTNKYIFNEAGRGSSGSSTTHRSLAVV